ncbi:hypothetical protein GFS31_03980 [Leptolyngbya sp. BL0902]|uniref:SWIM zinc finger family protein n=1 Tax=Leptolyngbya sp. BL0902 TaxID=1115757 RepID=UPI0018E86073|nr:DUF6880 family protein [Leptolyngbya sp. BL0902]QQE63729.1 hypothetical protein GFS31_03980 [Leptolyngbya sp. BL0902]
MAMCPSPTPLTESQIKALATDQSFERGQRYYRNGAIFNPVLQGQTLWADCEGTVVYQPRITLGPEGVEDSDCTCPYDWGGLCKHRVALLLTYIHKCDRIRPVPPVPDLLAQHSREDLVALVERMVQRHPDLLDWVDSPTTTDGDGPNLDNYRRAVERLFRGSDMNTMAAALAALAEQGHSFADRRDWVKAGDIYQLLLEAANDHYDYTVLEVDYNGAVGVEIQNIAEGLKDSLEQAQNLDMGRHRLWIGTFFQAVLKDIELGGMDYAYPASEALLEHSTDEDWAWVERQIHQLLRGAGGRKLGEWGRESLVDLLVKRAEKRGQATDANAVVLEIGTPQQKTFYHLRQGNFDAALSLARSHFMEMPGLAVQFANALLEADQPDLALDFIQSCQQQRDYYGYGEWLVDFLAQHGSPEQMVAAQFSSLKLRFTLDSYRELRAKAQTLGQWDSLRLQIIAHLKEKNRIPSLMDIALLEQDWKTALGYLKKLNCFDHPKYAILVAQALETDQPKTAMKLYREMIEDAIADRGRENYRKAVEYLKAVKRLSQATGQKVDFNQYVQTLRDQNKTLRALKEELDRANF